MCCVLVLFGVVVVVVLVVVVRLGENVWQQTEKRSRSSRSIRRMRSASPLLSWASGTARMATGRAPDIHQENLEEVGNWRVMGYVGYRDTMENETEEFMEHGV